MSVSASEDRMVHVGTIAVPYSSDEETFNDNFLAAQIRQNINKGGSVPLEEILAAAGMQGFEFGV